MKKNIFFIIIFLNIICFSQKNNNFGIEVSFTANSFYSNSDFDYKNVPGFRAGVFYQHYHNEKIAFQPELILSYQGTKYGTDFGYNTAKLWYITIPFLFKYYFVEKANIEIGPYIAYLFKAEEMSDANGRVLYTNLKNDLNLFDFGLKTGLSYNFNNGFFLNFSYSLGLTDVSKINSSKNSIIQIITLGYNF